MRDSFESLYYEPMLPYLTALVPLAPVEHIPQSEASAPKFDIIFEQILFSLHNQQLGILKKHRIAQNL